MKQFFSLVVLCLLVRSLGAQMIESGFEDSTLDPFHPQRCCGNTAVVVDWGDQARGGSKVAKLQWWENNYQNNRSSRGIEYTSEKHIRINKEGWYGFSFWVNAEGDNKFRLDSDIGIAQALANGGTATPSRPDCFVSWTWILDAKAKGLHLSHRYGGGGTTEVYLTDEIPAGRWVDMIFHMKYSEKNEGLMEVWVDEDCWGEKGEPTYAVYDTPLGLDCWENDALVSGTHLKFGMYCHDTSAYIDGEKRVIYYDQIAMIEGYPEDAWYLVQPERTTGATPPAPPSRLYSNARNGYMNLDWRDNVEMDLRGYYVYRSYRESGPFEKLNEIPVIDSEYVDRSVTTGRQSYYYVTAVDRSGYESPGSEQNSASVNSSMWRNDDVGTLGRSGSVVGEGGAFTISGSGLGVTGAEDAYNFTYFTAIGDCEVIARVMGIDGEIGALAGVSIRDSLEPDSKGVNLVVDEGGTGTFYTRSAVDSTASNVASGGVSLPVWLRLLRVGTQFSAFLSDDGVDWDTLGQVNISFEEEVYVGLTVSSFDPLNLAIATFDNVTVGGSDDAQNVRIVEAESYEFSSSADLESCSEGGLNIVFSQLGSWYLYNDLDFEEGCSLFRMRVSNSGPETRVILRTDRSADSTVGSIEIPSTGGEQEWVTISGVTDELIGVSQLYFILDGDVGDTAAINWFEYVVDDEADYGALDKWRLGQFGTLANAGDAANGSNPDLDLRANLMEYAVGTDPFDLDFDEVVMMGESEDGDYLTLSFDRVADPDLVYSVEATEDLAKEEWSTIWTSTGEGNVAGPVTVVDTKTKEEYPIRYLRLVVEGY